jgi:hypothetical protein
MPPEMAQSYPYITELVMAVYHDEASVVGSGCDDQFEFEFALDLLLDGIERLRQQELRYCCIWRPLKLASSTRVPERHR